MPLAILPVTLLMGSTLTLLIRHRVREDVAGAGWPIAALYGVNVSMVFPGMVKSDLWDSAVNAGDYNYRKEMENTAIAAITADEAALEILRGIEKNQEEIIFPFRDNKLIIRLYQLLPGLMTRVVSAPLLRPLKRTLRQKVSAA